MNRTLLLPVAGMLVIVLLVYGIVATSVTVPPTDPSAPSPSSAIKPPAPTLAEQRLAESAEVVAIAALADAGLGELVRCTHDEPLPGAPTTEPWPLANEDHTLTFLIDASARKLPLHDEQGTHTHDLTWTSGTAPVCRVQPRWVASLDITVTDEAGVPVTDAVVTVNGNTAPATASGRYRGYQSHAERSTGTNAPVAIVKATRGAEVGTNAAAINTDVVNITVALGRTDAPLGGIHELSQRSRAARALGRERALEHALTKALLREDLPADVTATLESWRKSQGLVVDRERFRAPARALVPRGRVPGKETVVHPAEIETQKRRAPTP